MMNTEEKNRFLRELTLNLQHKGFTVKEESEDGLLSVELDGRRLCSVLDTGAIRYWKEDAEGGIRNAALDRVTDITKTTAEYMSRLGAAPQLGIGPKGDYRLLGDFNDVVLAGHPAPPGGDGLYVPDESLQHQWRLLARRENDCQGPPPLPRYRAEGYT